MKSGIQKIKDSWRAWEEPTFPCWVWIEGHNHAGNCWSHWSKCPSAGRMIADTSGDDGSFIGYWHPDQPSAPEAKP